MTSFDDEYLISTAPAALEDDPDGTRRADARSAAWTHAERQGFHELRGDAASVTRGIERSAADGRQLTAVLPRTPRPGSLAADGVPVGTFAAFTKTLNVGGGHLVPAHLVAGVTVQAPHRRRGILRRMMTDDLARAAADGHVVAALTASEATIYRRFGFGCAMRERTVTVDRTAPVGLLATPSGSTELVDPRTLGGLAREVFARFHATNPGSIDRHEGTWSAVTGVGSSADGSDDEGVRAAVHVSATVGTTGGAAGIAGTGGSVGSGGPAGSGGSAGSGTPGGTDGADRTGGATPSATSAPAGEVDGYVTWRTAEVPAGSAEAPAGRQLQVIDLVAATDEAYLGLWDLLLSIDLVTSVQYPNARLDDPLQLALTNGRAIRVTDEEDHVWFRLLDLPAAFEARPYLVDGSVTLRVHDALGHGEGTWRLTSAGGAGRLERVTDAGEVGTASGPDLSLDVADLGALWLGGVDPVTLRQAGLLGEHRAGAAAELRALLRPERQLHGITYF